MSVTPSDCITERHLMLFGTIVRRLAATNFDDFVIQIGI